MIAPFHFSQRTLYSSSSTGTKISVSGLKEGGGDVAEGGEGFRRWIDEDGDKVWLFENNSAKL